MCTIPIILSYAANEADLGVSSVPIMAITVPAGPATGTFTIDYHMIDDDLDLEGDEEFSVFILGLPAPQQFGIATVTILDNDASKDCLHVCTKYLLGEHERAPRRRAKHEKNLYVYVCL